jgi:hypothetical protein
MRSKRKLIGGARASKSSVAKAKSSVAKAKASVAKAKKSSKASVAKAKVAKASVAKASVAKAKVAKASVAKASVAKAKPIVPMGTVFIVNTTNDIVSKFEKGKYKYKKHDYGYKLVNISSDGSMYLIQSVAEHHTNANGTDGTDGTPTTSRHIQDLLNKSKA